MSVAASDIRLVQTCSSCPEQYDAYHGDQVVGYLRLRWGHFTVRFPGVVGTVIYDAEVGRSGYEGNFDTESQRAYHLGIAKVAIARKLMGIP